MVNREQVKKLLDADVASLRGRRREGRVLLARLGRKARAAAANPTQVNLDKLRREAELVGDYLQRTAEPSDILRARTPEEEGADDGRVD